MTDFISFLKTTRLFQGINDEETEAVLSCLSAEVRAFRKGQYIFRIGERITSAALLLEGCVHIQKEDYWGNLSILSEIGEGELFGEAYAGPGGAAMENNVAAVKDSTVLFLNMNRILTVCSSACRYHTRIIQNYLAILAAKNRLLAQKLEHMSQRTTRKKLLSYLSAQSGKAGSPAFTIPFNRQQLADYLSVDRSAMSNELCKMRDEGILDFNKSRFVLHGPPGENRS